MDSSSSRMFRSGRRLDDTRELFISTLRMGLLSTPTFLRLCNNSAILLLGHDIDETDGADRKVFNAKFMFNNMKSGSIMHF